MALFSLGLKSLTEGLNVEPDPPPNGFEAIYAANGLSATGAVGAYAAGAGA
jgi:hypothetical protein